MEEAEAGYFSTPSKRRPVEFFKKLSFRSVPWGRACRIRRATAAWILSSCSASSITNGTMPEGACVVHRWPYIGEVQVGD